MNRRSVERLRHRIVAPPNGGGILHDCCAIWRSPRTHPVPNDCIDDGVCPIDHCVNIVHVSPLVGDPIKRKCA